MNPFVALHAGSSHLSMDDISHAVTWAQRDALHVFNCHSTTTTTCREQICNTRIRTTRTRPSYNTSPCSSPCIVCSNVKCASRARVQPRRHFYRLTSFFPIVYIIAVQQKYVWSKFKVGSKKRFLPQSVGVNARGSSDQILQIAVINEYVSKFGWDPFSDLWD